MRLSRFVAATCLACGLPLGAQTGPGVSADLARQRAAVLRDVSYDLALDVTARDSAVGWISIEFTRAGGAGDLVVDFRGPRLSRVAANGRRIPRLAWRNGHFVVPARYLLAGHNQVTAEFTAAVAAAGAPSLRVDDARDSSTYQYTLLVPSDAHALFPSFDQPDL